MEAHELCLLSSGLAIGQVDLPQIPCLPIYTDFFPQVPQENVALALRRKREHQQPVVTPRGTEADTTGGIAAVSVGKQPFQLSTGIALRANCGRKGNALGLRKDGQVRSGSRESRHGCGASCGTSRESTGEPVRGASQKAGCGLPRPKARD